MSDQPEAIAIAHPCDIDLLSRRLPRPDARAIDAARARQDSLTKPPGALGRLEQLAVFMAGWQSCDRPRIACAQALVFAGNHGVCARGVNPFPQAVTAAMVENFRSGGAAINRLCAWAGADLQVVALALDEPTADFTTAPAMTADETAAAFNTGAAAVDPGADVLVLGEMGIGNSTVAAALAAAVLGGAGADWAGPGTGADAGTLLRKVAAVDAALALHRARDAGRILMCLGGREQAAICGAVVAARMARIPVILDGFICTAAAAVLHAADPAFLAHCLAGHLSAEPGHRRLLEGLGLEPVLTLDLRLGEGSGAALALGVLRAALECHDGMATFAEAGIAPG